VTDYGGKKTGGGDGDKADKPAAENKKPGTKKRFGGSRTRFRSGLVCFVAVAATRFFFRHSPSRNQPAPLIETTGR